MHNGQNEYLPYMQRTKRSLNSHRTHLTGQVKDSVYFSPVESEMWFIN